MRMHLMTLFLLITGLVSLQGCSHGTWFPKNKQTVRTQTYWDRASQSCNPVLERMELCERGKHAPGLDDCRSVSKDKR